MFYESRGVDRIFLMDRLWGVGGGGKVIGARRPKSEKEEGRGASDMVGFSGVWVFRRWDYFWGGLKVVLVVGCDESGRYCIVSGETAMEEKRSEI